LEGPIATGAAEGATWYPPVDTTATGEDALKARTKAAMSQGMGLEGDVDADKTFGSKYHSSSGKTINLPDEYDQEQSWD